MTPSLRALVLSAAIALPSAARADVEPDPIHQVSLTVSPLHLFLPFFELQGEYAVSRNVGVALIAGIGSVSLTDDGSETSFFIWELGAKVAGYVVGDFEEGLQVGLEALYLKVSAEAADDFASGSVFGNGFSLSPFIGYKLIADFGLTFEAQLGPAFIFASAESETESASDFAIGPMLNLNLGWSF
jgi:hypothetical protein